MMNLLKHQELHILQSKHFIQKARDLAPHLCDTSDEELKFQYLDSLRNLKNYIDEKRLRYSLQVFVVAQAVISCQEGSYLVGKT